MGYYKNLEIAMATEEADRPVTRRQLTRRRRETYQAPRRWDMSKLDTFMMLAAVPLAFGLGVVVTLMAVAS